MKKLIKNNMLKKLFIVAGIATLVLCNFGCNNNKNKFVEEEKFEETEKPKLYDFDANYNGKKIVVAYFSATGNTKVVAEKIAELFSCETVEIEPEVPYTENDLTSFDEGTRPMRENKYDPFNPPEFSEDEVIPEGTILELPKIKKIDLNKYDTIFLGYPIWFNDAPKIIYRFISTVNLKNKTILPFCTSGSDDISPSDQNLANFAPADINFMSGRRFTKDSTIDEIKEWATWVSADIP